VGGLTLSKALFKKVDQGGRQTGSEDTWRRDKFEFPFELMSNNSNKKLIKTPNDRFKIDYTSFKRSKMLHSDLKSSGNNII